MLPRRQGDRSEGGARVEKQHSLLIWRLFFSLFALYHRAKNPRRGCL